MKINVYQITLIVLFLIGCGLRLVFFSYNRPFWNDECALALNIRDTWNYIEPLKYSQAAPHLFMYLSKLIYTIFGQTEMRLRIIPLLSAIAGLGVFYFLSENFFTKKSSVLIAFALCSFCYPLCYYAQEFKQYSSDVLCFELILLSYFYLDKIKTLKAKILYGAVCGILIWLAFPSAFAIFAVFLTLLIFNFQKFRMLLPALIPICINIILFYFVNKQLNSNEFLHTFWADGFINQGFLHFLQLCISNIKYVFASGLPFFFIAAGLIVIAIRDFKDSRNVLIFSPLCLTLLLSWLSIYPFSTRLILFLIPVFILLTVKILDYINIKNKYLSGLFVILASFVLILPQGIDCVQTILNKKFGHNEDIKTALKIAKANTNTGDIIYISDGSEILYEYYGAIAGIKNPVHFDDKRYNDDAEYLNHLEDTLEKGMTYCWILAHYPQKDRRLNSVKEWAKGKENFKIFTDNYSNAVIIFKMR